MRTKIRVWDLPTRIFHWALVLCVIGSVATAQIGGAAMAWHFRCGYAILTLLLFRLVWGVVGGQWSRFNSFMYTPNTILAYIRGKGRPEQSIGHSPTGALSVFALLLVLLMQVISGLTSDDEITAAGPLVSFVSNAWVTNTTFYHANVGKFILLGLLALHIGAIIYYQLTKKQNLTRPMINGDKEVDMVSVSSKDTAASRLLAIFILIGSALFVAWVAALAV
jgi:cytochrome b